MNVSRDHASTSKDKDIAISSISNSKERLSFYRERENREVPVQKGPKVHTGPFNTQCIFMENAKTLFEKVVGLLSKLKLRYQEVDAYSLSMGSQQISIESVQGIAGLHLIKFNAEHPVNQTIIEVLSK
jgi:DNA relaxase NicK